MAHRPRMRELPSEAPVEDDEAFASSVEDNQQADREEENVLEVQTTTSNEEGGDDDQHVRARLRIEHGERHPQSQTREPVNKSPIKTPRKSQRPVIDDGRKRYAPRRRK